MVNTYVFEDFPVKLCQEKYDDEKKQLHKSFLSKYPELENRFEIVNNELMFLISESAEISEQNWAVDFLESNVNNERSYNGLGTKLDDELYADLYTLFSNEDYDGDVYFASSTDKCIVETVGKFDSRYSFKLKKDGLHWTDEEEEYYDEDYDEEWYEEESIPEQEDQSPPPKIDITPEMSIEIDKIQELCREMNIQDVHWKEWGNFFKGKGYSVEVKLFTMIIIKLPGFNFVVDNKENDGVPEEAHFYEGKFAGWIESK